MLKLLLSLFNSPHEVPDLPEPLGFEDAETIQRREELAKRRAEWHKENRRSPSHILNGGGRWRREAR